jgi:hypothetical protein
MALSSDRLNELHAKAAAAVDGQWFSIPASDLLALTSDVYDLRGTPITVTLMTGTTTAGVDPGAGAPIGGQGIGVDPNPKDPVSTDQT